MSVYPRNLSAFLNRLSGYNKNNIKMNVLGSANASQGDTIQVDLPTNSIVDLSSLAWSFIVTYAAAGAHGANNAQGVATDSNADLPQNAETLINRLAVEVNGQTLVNIQNYNLLHQMLLNTSATEDYQRQRLVAQATQSATQSANAAVQQHRVVDSWLGFLGSARPNFLDTSLLGNVRITITLAGSEVITGDHADITRAYAITDQHFSCDVISISDGIYDAMIDQMLAS
jgi:hypothetical protein